MKREWTIRTAEPRDLPVWAEMRSALWPESATTHAAELEAYFNGSSIDIEIAYLLETGNKVAGFVELNIRNFAEGSRQARVPYLEAWYVSPRYRGCGAGRLLIQEAENWARSQGFSELASDTTIDNERSIAMHKHMGFDETERVVCFLKKL